jgi:2-dehydropantoate 2-reductase
MLGGLMSETIPHILIFGTGAVGSYIGGRLQSVLGADPAGYVTFYGRSAMGAALAQHGLTLSHFDREPLKLPPERLDYRDDLAGISAPDLIFLCVKSQDTAAAAAQIKAQGWTAPIVSWQNGVGNLDTLQKALPDRQIIAAMVPYNVTLSAPGQFHCGTGGALHMGESRHDAVTAAVAALRRAGEEVNVTADIESYQWGKLIINLNNALNALSGGTLLAGFSERPYRKAWAASMDEGLAILARAGVTPGAYNGTDPAKLGRLLRLPNFLFRPIFGKIAKVDAAARSSMLDDLDAGKRAEIDYLQGAIIKLAAEHGLTAPVNQRIYDAAVEAFEAGHSPKLSGAQIWDTARGKASLS